MGSRFRASGPVQPFLLFLFRMTAFKGAGHSDDIDYCLESKQGGAVKPFEFDAHQKAVSDIPDEKSV